MQFKLKDVDGFKMILAKKGFTQRHFSLQANIDRSYMNRIIKHGSTFGTVTAKKISDTLGMEFEELYIIVGA